MKLDRYSQLHRVVTNIVVMHVTNLPKRSYFRFQIIFIFVSDDMEWVRKNIYNRVKRGFNVFLSQSGQPENSESIGNYQFSKNN